MVNMTYKKIENVPITVQELIRLYEQDEFIPYTVFGGLGYGKSSYAIQCLALAYGLKKGNNRPDWEAVKSRIVFTPEEFLSVVSKKYKRRDIAIIWDDAGVWLNSLDYYKPLVKAVTKYLSVARTDFGSIIFTTPNPGWLTKKVRMMSSARLVRINKYATIKYDKKDGDQNYYRYRNAIVYQLWESPDGKRNGAKTIYNDKFNANLPDDVYEWYKPKRDKYAEIVKRMIVDEVEKKRYQEKLSKKIGKETGENSDTQD